MLKVKNQFITARSYAPASARQRRSILRRFVAVMPPDVCDITTDDVVAWWATTAELKPASRRAHLMAARQFMDYCIAAGLRDDDPTRILRAPTVHRGPPKVLTGPEVARLRAAPMTDQERLVILLQLDLGLRVGEVSRMTAADVTDGRTVAVHGKGGKVSLLPLPAHLAPLMPTEGRVVEATPTALSKRVVKLLERADIHGHSAHSLRRTFATEASRRGVPAHVIAALLRHSSVATSAHYVNVTDDDMRSAV